MIPAWLLDTFAAVMLAVAAVSAARLAVARPWRPGAAVLADIDVAHLLMAIAMAGMLTSSLQTLPDGAWAVIFAVMTAWFGYRVARDAQVSGVRALAGGHCAPHLIHAAAMLYMFVALTPPAAHGSGGMGGMSSMGTLEMPFLAFVFALALIGYSIWDLDQLSGPGTSGHYSLAVARVAPAPPVLVGAPAGPGAAGAPAGPGAAGPGAAGPGAAGPGAAGPGAAAVAASAGGQLDVAVATEPAAPDRAPLTDAVGAPGPAGGSGRGVLAPWVTTTCRIAMGITMAFMLLITI